MPKLLQLIKNKYVIATIVFLAIILFISENNIFVSHRLRHEVNRLHKEEVQLQQDIAEDSTLMLSLEDDLAAKERYAREHYYMRAENEDIFVIKDSKK